MGSQVSTPRPQECSFACSSTQLLITRLRISCPQSPGSGNFASHRRSSVLFRQTRSSRGSNTCRRFRASVEISTNTSAEFHARSSCSHRNTLIFNALAGWSPAPDLALRMLSRHRGDMVAKNPFQATAQRDWMTVNPSRENSCNTNRFV